MSPETVHLSVALIVLAFAIASLPGLWWYLVGQPRFRRRADLYLEHTSICDGHRCGCSTCSAFRREIGWAR